MRARGSLAPLRAVLLLIAAPLVAFAAASHGRLGDRAIGLAHVSSALTAVVLGVGALFVIAGLAGLLLQSRRRRRKPGDVPEHVVTWQAGRGAQVAALLVVLPLTVIPIWFAVTAAGHHHAAAPATTAPAGPSVPSMPHATAASHAGSEPGMGALLAAAAVLVVAGAVGLLAHRRRPASADRPTETSEVKSARAPDARLRGAAAELDTSDDVRLAISRCYAALQRSLDGAGLSRTPVRTPSELLAAAIDRGLVPAGPATELTRIFERARFSSDLLTDRDREAARAALAAAEVPSEVRS